MYFKKYPHHELPLPAEVVGAFLVWLSVVPAEVVGAFIVWLSVVPVEVVGAFIVWPSFKVVGYLVEASVGWFVVASSFSPVKAIHYTRLLNSY